MADAARPTGCRMLVTRRAVAFFLVCAAVFPNLPAAAQCTSTVQTGSTTSIVALAQRCGTTVGDLRRANPGRNLSQPARINIPGGRTNAAPDTLRNQIAPRPPAISATRQRPVAAAAGAPMTKEAGTAYEIRRGDTLSAIAARRAIPLGSLLAANPGIRPEHLVVGEIIRLPDR